MFLISKIKLSDRISEVMHRFTFEIWSIVKQLYQLFRERQHTMSIFVYIDVESANSHLQFHLTKNRNTVLNDPTGKI